MHLNVIAYLSVAVTSENVEWRQKRKEGAEGEEEAVQSLIWGNDVIGNGGVEGLGEQAASITTGVRFN